MAFSDDFGDTPPSIVPFSVSMRRASKRRRSRLARSETQPFACEESAHYPVFNPNDPRHNPALERSVCLDDVDNIPQPTHPAGSIRWMQGLPGRSLRRARSGLQALRSGLHRRPIPGVDGGHANNGLWSSSDSAGASSSRHARFFSSTVSEASTEEDYDFGTDLYRTGCNTYPGNTRERSKDISISSPPNIPYSNPAPLSTSSTVADATLAPPEEMTADPFPDNSLPSTAGQDIHNSGNTPGAALEDECTAEPPKSSEHPRPDEDVPTPVESSNHNSPISSIQQIPVDSNEVVPGTFADSDISHVSGGETDAMIVDDASRRSSSSVVRQSQVEPIRSGEVEVTVTTEEIHTTSSHVDCLGTGIVEEGIVQTPAAETASSNKLSDNAPAVPAVELGGLGGIEYYLSSLNTLGASDACENKTSDEEPSPNSLSEEDGQAHLSPWIPAEKRDRTSPLSLQDEYFFVDGKSTDLRPDRGDNPIKGERGFVGDGGLHSGPGLDRNLSIRTQDIPEIIGPGGSMGIPSPRPLRRDREGSDSTEEYLVTYSLLHQHYFS
ncbi:hypothetical protein ASPVEDRAFT_40894 [Aspergillus versicolor CBS 583.65]|uniref:Uncharacterized protein n=1 Tax=Aspergillus versicolor CBS 583.65 TaxID=1036611 RepID=A0A1L9PIM1_ASPVE|nr:uncharacterized protein ASPVEDRAFT_40894 [Aspergillus versicolor CBS 583.65]OJJ01341.1 hypothetical protein ASPVEDRAFT_40894 [Aspergillus versicolor CBS 583.65]